MAVRYFSASGVISSRSGSPAIYDRSDGGHSCGAFKAERRAVAMLCKCDHCMMVRKQVSALCWQEKENHGKVQQVRHDQADEDALSKVRGMEQSNRAGLVSTDESPDSHRAPSRAGRYSGYALLSDDPMPSRHGHHGRPLRLPAHGDCARSAPSTAPPTARDRDGPRGSWDGLSSGFHVRHGITVHLLGIFTVP
jgi:hypothetical protein